MDDTQDPQHEPTTPEAAPPPPTTPEPATPVEPPPSAPPVAPPAPVAPVPPVYPPPAATAPPVPASGAPTAPPPPVYVQPVPAPAASGSGRTAAIVIAIIAACVLVLIGLGIAIFFVAQSAIRSLDSGATPVAEESEEPRDPADEPEGLAPEILPLVEGEPGPATAADPTVCPDECFPYEVFGEIVLDASVYSELGTGNQQEEWGDYPNTTPGKEYTYTAKYWKDGEGTPVECFVAYGQVPIATRYDERPVAPDDTIAYLGYFTSDDEYSTLQESARTFVDSAAAEAHMTTFKELVAGCTSYEIGTGSEYWTADVSPTPALDLPDSVAAVGWVEDSPFGRYYATDLQRGNLVVRATLYTDGGVTEEQYRDYLEALAQQLAALETE